MLHTSEEDLLVSLRNNGHCLSGTHIHFPNLTLRIAISDKARTNYVRRGNIKVHALLVVVDYRSFLKNVLYALKHYLVNKSLIENFNAKIIEPC